MKYRYKEPVLTRILKEDAKRVCTQERMERFWKNFENKLDGQQAEQNKRPEKRALRTVGFWVLTISMCLAVFIGSAFLFSKLLTPDLAGTATVTITEQLPPLAETPKTGTGIASWIALVIAFGLSAVLVVVIYRVIIHLRYKNLVRRVVIKAIRTEECRKAR